MIDISLDGVGSQADLLRRLDSIRSDIKSGAVSLDTGGRQAAFYSGKLGIADSIDFFWKIFPESARDVVSDIAGTTVGEKLNKIGGDSAIFLENFGEKLKELGFSEEQRVAIAEEYFGTGNDNIWKAASENFARNAKGKVIAIVDPTVFDKIFGQVELPILLENAAVTHINGIPKGALLSTARAYVAQGAESVSKAAFDILASTLNNAERGNNGGFLARALVDHDLSRLSAAIEGNVVGEFDKLGAKFRQFGEFGKTSLRDSILKMGGVLNLLGVAAAGVEIYVTYRKEGFDGALDKAFEEGGKLGFGMLVGGAALTGVTAVFGSVPFAVSALVVGVGAVAGIIDLGDAFNKLMALPDETIPADPEQLLGGSTIKLVEAGGTPPVAPGHTFFSYAESALTATTESDFISAGNVGEIYGLGGDDFILTENDGTVSRNSVTFAYGGDGNDVITARGASVLSGGAGNDQFIPRAGSIKINGDSGFDAVNYGAVDAPNGLKLKFEKSGTSASNAAPNIVVTKEDGVDTISTVELIKLTDRPDSIIVNTDALQSWVRIDMGLSDRSQDGIRNVDVVDYSAVTRGLSYNSGKVRFVGASDNENLIVTGADKVVLTAADDRILNAAAGTIVETGDGADIVYLMGHDVAIADLSAQDRIQAGGFWGLHGGLHNAASNSALAVSPDGMFKYALNASGELRITSLFGNMWVLNYGDAGAPGPKPGDIHLYEVKFLATRILADWPNGMTMDAVWDVLNMLVKTEFGVPLFKGADPLVLDLDGDGIELTPRSTASPLFDIDGDLYAEHTGWVKGDDGFLVRDLDGNGRIDDVTEMFGTASHSGFAALSLMDRNGDGRVDAQDDVEDLNGNGVLDPTESAIAPGYRFADLRVWRDLDQDGVTDSGELFTLNALGIASLAVTDTASSEIVAGNHVSSVSHYTRTDGTTGLSADVVLSVDNIETTYVGAPIVVTAAAAALPEIAGRGTLVSLREAMSLSPAARVAVETALPSLSSLSMDALRQAATPVLVAWGDASPLDDGDGDPATLPPKLKPHADVSILVQVDQNGHEHVVDFAFVTAADASGTVSFWHLGSGSPVRDADGRVIARPTLAQVRASPVPAGAVWQTISGDLVGIVERMIGEDLPVDRVQPAGTTSLPGATKLFETLLGTIDLAVVRLVVQGGPLAPYFAALGYDPDTNHFVSTTERELAPVYEAILADAAANGHDAAWLRQWRPILDLVVGDYERRGGAVLLDTYGFIAQNVVSAFESVAGPMSFMDVATAFGIPGDVIVAGTGLVDGTGLEDILYGTGGDFTLRGGQGADEYVVGHAIGHSVIDDFEAPLTAAYDILRLVFLDPDDVYATREGTDLLLSVTATGETLRVRRQFEGELPGLFGAGDLSEDTGVNEIVFADGTVWSKFDIAMAVSHPDAAGTVLEGTPDNDYLDGGAGDDVLRGYGDSDVYVYARGYGNDRIEDFEDFLLRDAVDVLILSGLTPDDITYTRDGQSNDLIIKIKGTNESLTIKDQFNATYTGVFGTRWLSRIEAITFADGSSASADDVMAAILASEKTAGNDTIYGFSREDTLDGGAGDDVLSGGNENDTYLFGLGSGHDTIKDGQFNILSGSDDTVVFGAGIGVDDVIFERDGETDDMIVRIRGTDDTLRLANQYTVAETIVFGAVAFDRIETFRWADGTTRDWWTIEKGIIAAAKTDGDDVIVGTHFDDVLDGGAGNDTLKGGDGDDTYLFGFGGGHDTIIEHRVNILASSNDAVVFGPGVTRADVTFTRPAETNDLVATLSDGSSLTIQGIFDVVFGIGQYAFNRVEQFRFADDPSATLSLFDVQDILLTGTPGNDVLEGYELDETLDGGAGDDLLIGHNGDDTYVFGRGYGHDTVKDEETNFLAGDKGDLIVFEPGIGPSDIQVVRTDDPSALKLVIRDTGDTLTLVGQNDYTGINWQPRQIERFTFADGTDWTAGDVSARYLAEAGTPGDDTITGFYTPDILSGGLGNDVLRGEDGGDTYLWSPGQGDDVIEEAVRIITYDQADTVQFGFGVTLADLDVARVGDDLVITAKAGGSLTIRNQFSGTAFNAVERFGFSDGTLLTQAAFEALTMIGTPGADLIVGSERNDVFAGGAGDDVILGKGGSDRYAYDFGDGNDVIVEPQSAGVDRLAFGAGIGIADVTLAPATDDPDTVVVSIRGNQGSIRLQGQNAPNRSGIEEIAFADGTVWDRRFFMQLAGIGPHLVTGTAASETLMGTEGDDLFEGGAGDDILTGRQGWDTYRFGPGSGHDVISELSYAPEGQYDLVDFGTLTLPDVSIRRAGADLVVTIDATGETLTVTGEFQDSWGGVELLRFADATWDRDTIMRHLAQRGTAGSDDLVGTPDQDFLIGGAGDDRLDGGSNDDTYVYARGDGSDTIVERTFGGYNERLLLDGIAPSDVVLGRSGNDAVLTVAPVTPGAATSAIRLTAEFDDFFGQGVEEIRFGDGTVWTQADLRARWLAQSSTPGNDAISGFNTEDVLRGGQGDDLLQGGAQSDVYVYARGDGNDAIVEEWGNGSADGLTLNGIAPRDVSLVRSDLDVTLVIGTSVPGGTDGGSIRLEAELDDYFGRGVEKISFSDGSVWTPTNLRKMLLEQASTVGDDIIVGFNTDDRLRGRAGDDVLRGAEGDDTYIYARGDGHDTIVEAPYAGDADKLVLQGILPTDIRVSRVDADVTLQIAPGPAASDGGSVVLLDQFGTGPGRGIEAVTFDDGTTWNRDTIRSRYLTDAATTGDDTIVGFVDRNDVILGGDGNDRLEGLSGDDQLSGGAGDDILVGGDGADTFDGGAGFDTAVLGDIPAGWTVDLERSLATSGLIRETLVSIESVVTGSGNDTLRGDAQDNRLAGAAGSDVYLWGRGGGNDTVFERDGDFGTDVLQLDGLIPSDVRLEHAADDLHVVDLATGERLTVLRQFAGANAGIEQIVFADGTRLDRAAIVTGAIYVGTSQADDIIGSNAAEVFDWSAGDDTLAGGGGADTYRFARGSGHDAIVESSGPSDIDTVDLVGLTMADVSLARIGSDLVLTIDTSGETLTVADHFLSTERGIERVTFADGHVYDRTALLIATATAGTAGNDILTGTPADDALNGKGGDDTIAGGAGNDIYVYARSDGADTITDDGVLDGNADTVVLQHILPQDVMATRNGDNAILTIAPSSASSHDGGSVTLVNQLDQNYEKGVERIVFDDGTVWSAADLRIRILRGASTPGNDVVTGYNTADIIEAGLGDDTISGGYGSDTYVYTRGDGNDVIDEYSPLGGSDDRLLLRGITPSQVRLERNGDDSILVIAPSVTGGSQSRITLKSQLEPNAGKGIETIVFGDGASWSAATLRVRTIEAAMTAGDDVIEGYGTDDVLDAGAGNDTLRGGAGSDTYRYGSAGVGNLVIDDRGYGFQGSDKLVFNALDAGDVQFSRIGTSKDLIIRVLATGKTLTLEGQFDDGQIGTIETIQFANGTVWNGAYSAEPAPSFVAGTAGDDTITPPANGFTIQAGTGNDTIFLAGNGGNTIRFAKGDGHDVLDNPGGGYTRDDTLDLTDILPGEISLSKVGDALLVTVPATGDSINVKWQFWNGVQDYGIAHIRFADGTFWARQDIQQRLADQQGSSSPIGTSNDDVLVAGSGDKTLAGLAGNDTYRYTAATGGNVVIDDQAYGFQNSGADKLVLTDLNAGNVTLSRAGSSSDLLFTVTGTGKILTLKGQFDPNTYGTIESFQFADGTVWSAQDVRQRLLDQESAAPFGGVYGYEADETLVAGPGDKTLLGYAGNDTYRYTAATGGNVVIDDQAYGFQNSGADKLVLTDLNAGDVTLSRAGSSSDLVVTVTATGKTLTLKGQFDPNTYGTIESFLFADGTSWSAQDVRQTLLAQQSAASSGTVSGFYTDDVLVAGPGSKTLAGYSGNDTYRYTAATGGNVVIDDQAYGFQSSGSDKLVLTDLNAGAITLSRIGTSSDLVVAVTATGKTLTLRGQFDPNTYGTIESIQFADGTTWSAQDVVDRLLEQGGGTGTSNDDTLSAGSGDKTLSGLAGNDTYRYTAATGGNVVIDDQAYGFQNSGADKLVLTDLNAGDVTLSRAGSSSDLVVVVTGTGKTLTLKGQFDPNTYGTIESVLFADGTTWSAQDVRQTLLAQQSAASSGTVSGFYTDDVLTAGPGDKTLLGYTGNDTYRYTAATGGNMVIDDQAYGFQSSGADKLVLTDLNAADIALSRSGGSSDLAITVATTGKTLTLKGQFDPNAYGTIESLLFADGTTWSAQDVRRRLLDQESAAPSGGVYGYEGDETLVAGPGDKTLLGYAGNDIYRYTAATGGNVVVDDQAYGFQSSGSDKLVLTDVDPGDVVMSRTGSGGRDVFMTMSSTGKSLTIRGEFDDNAYGTIETVQFADGTAWYQADIGARARIEGTSGSDVLTGSSFGDLIYGGSGDDILTGGGAADTFIFQPGSGQDRITDFSVTGGSHDLLDIAAYGFADFAAVLSATTTSAGSATIQLSAMDAVTLTGVTNDMLNGRPELVRLS